MTGEFNTSDVGLFEREYVRRGVRLGGGVFTLVRLARIPDSAYEHDQEPEGHEQPADLHRATSSSTTP